MSLLNSNFDIVSVDNPVAVAAVAQVLPANSALVGSPVFNTNGTPNVGLVPPGTIVVMNATGEAVLGTALDTATAATRAANTKMAFVVIDGNTDYSGAFTNKLTCLHGGFTMVTDQVTGTLSTFTPGTPVSFAAGKLIVATTNLQIIGVVGPAGYDATLGTVQVIVPQGGL